MDEQRIFNGREHLDFYTQMVFRTCSERDPYRRALFYALGLSGDVRRHIQDLYDFDERGIIIEGLERGWQTSGSLRVCRLAFNLYNGYTGDDCPRLATPYHLFSDNLLPYLLEAVRVRFEE